MFLSTYIRDVAKPNVSDELYTDLLHACMVGKHFNNSQVSNAEWTALIGKNSDKIKNFLKKMGYLEYNENNVYFMFDNFIAKAENYFKIHYDIITVF